MPRGDDSHTNAVSDGRRAKRYRAMLNEVTDTHAMRQHADARGHAEYCFWADTQYRRASL